jgi:hypothetical protein
MFEYTRVTCAMYCDTLQKVRDTKSKLIINTWNKHLVTTVAKSAIPSVVMYISDV